MHINKSRILGWLVPGLGALVVAGALLAWQWPLGEHEPTRTVSNAGLGDEARTTADIVQVRATQYGARELRVTLNIADGWHVNATPASLDFLIPTKITAAAGKPVPLSVDYPAGRNIDSGLGDAPWMVYDDGKTIRATLPEQMPEEPLNISVRVQACHDNGRCLAPDTLHTHPSPGASP